METIDMLSEIRLDYPELTINNVFSFNLNEYGFYDVEVEVSRKVMSDNTITFKIILAYPFLKYVELNEKERIKWTLKTNI